MRSSKTVAALNEFGRTRLSKHFFMRDFLFSDIAAIHGLTNAPDDTDLAVAAGTRLCAELLEPLQNVFGRIAIRSAYRSSQVNGLGAEMQNAGKPGYNCAANEKNYAGHIWDRRDAGGCMGATACIVLPAAEMVPGPPSGGPGGPTRGSHATIQSSSQALQRTPTRPRE